MPDYYFALFVLRPVAGTPLGWWEQDAVGADSSGAFDDIVYNHTPPHLKHVWES